MAAAEDGFEPAASDEQLDFAVVTAPAALDAALALLRPGGTCLVFAAPAAPVPVLLDRVYRSELVLVGSRSATPASLREALELIASGRVRVDDLVTDVLPLARLRRGPRRGTGRRSGAEGRLPALTGMRAAIFHGPGDVRIEDVPVAEPGPGEVLVRVEAALTDGTDAKCYLRGHPVLLGDDAVAVRPRVRRHRRARSAPARRSPSATASPAPTPRPATPAAVPGRPRGALHRAVSAAERRVRRVPARARADRARRTCTRCPTASSRPSRAMCEPLACALHGVEATEARAGDRVCVLGRGALGQMLAAALAARGCDVVALGSTDPDPVGAFDRVIEAAGQPEAWERAVRLAAPGATVVLFGGLKAGASVPVDAYRLHYEALTLRGVFHHAPRHVRAALELVAARPGAVPRIDHARVRARRRRGAARDDRGHPAAGRTAEGADQTVRAACAASHSSSSVVK